MNRISSDSFLSIIRGPALPAAILLALTVSSYCKDEPKGPAPTRADAVAVSDKPTILFLGDSLTAGRGLAPEDAVPALIQAKVAEAGLDYRVLNGGRSGDTTAGGLSRLGWYLRPEMKLQAVVIGLGSNDAMRGLPVSEIEANLEEIVRKIRAFDPAIKIFLFQMHIFPNMGPQYAGKYEKLFGRVARTEKITLLPFPMIDVGGRPELNQADGIHPNVEGTRMVAERVWNSLKTHL